MIKELKLINWKSFSEATVYIDRLTILIGTNASGKSNLLDALLFLQRIALGRSITAAIAGDAESPGIRGGLEWVIRKPERQLRLEVLIQDPGIDTIVYHYVIEIAISGVRAELVGESLTRIKDRPRSTPLERNFYHTDLDEVSGAAIPAYFYTGTQGRGKRFDMNRAYCILSQMESQSFRREVSEGARLVQEQLQRIFILDPIPSHMRNYSIFSDKIQADGANIAGVLAALPQDRKQEVEVIVTRYLKQLPERDIQRVWTEPVGKFGTDAMLYCEEHWSDNSATNIVDLRGMSDGTLRFLAIITALLTQEKYSLLVVEEVDNGLHPSRAHVLIQMLRELAKQRAIDIIVTTHNPAVLDALGNRMVPFMSVVHRDRITGASTITLLEKLDLLPKLMAAGTLGRLATQGQIESALKTQAED
ncbi:MAG: AAA family ATPase [Candidatus Competibacteraceae bacterium]|nr:AAA family ATPase [Candidatus Competibacteraceae bacterium]